ncbi:MAG: cohesin domain-containing protein [Bacteroidota bacterium]
MKKTFIALLFSSFFITNALLAQIDAAGFAGFIQPGDDALVPGADVTIEQLFTGDVCNSVTPPDDLYHCILPQNIDGPLRVTITKNENWLDGVTTLDLVFIQKHILFIDPITSGESQIAADADNSGSISTFDILLLQKLILNQESALTDVPSWRFLPTWTVLNVTGFQSHWGNIPGDPYGTTPFNFDADFGLSNFEYPFYLDVPLEFYWLATNDQFDLGNFSFNAIKVGDVNFTNQQLALTGGVEGQDRQAKNAPSITWNGLIKKGEEVTIPVKASGVGEILGYQFGMWLSPEDFELVDITQGDLPSFTKDNFGLTELKEGKIRTLWFDTEGQAADLSDETVLFNLKLKAKRNIVDLSEAIKLDAESMKGEYYDTNKEISPFALELDVQQTVAFERNLELLDHYPNPVDHQMTLELLLDNDSDLEIQIFDVYGKQIKSYTQSGAKGLNKIVLEDMDELSNGTHFLRVIDAEGHIAVKQFVAIK